jgi:hypothetical protein
MPRFFSIATLCFDLIISASAICMGISRCCVVFIADGCDQRKFLKSSAWIRSDPSSTRLACCRQMVNALVKKTVLPRRKACRRYTSNGKYVVPKTNRLKIYSAAWNVASDFGICLTTAVTARIESSCEKTTKPTELYKATYLSYPR